MHAHITYITYIHTLGKHETSRRKSMEASNLSWSKSHLPEVWAALDHEYSYWTCSHQSMYHSRHLLILPLANVSLHNLPSRNILFVTFGQYPPFCLVNCISTPRIFHCSICTTLVDQNLSS